MRHLALLASALLLFACGDDTSTPMDGGPTGECTRHADCDDGIFCNGTELCTPDDPSADPIGCTLGALPCGEGLLCSETSMRCETDCMLAPDGDGDGIPAIGCGGSDCDDADPNRFPGNVEVCDPDEHDEDCDPRTFGERDQDDDGSIDATCCNADPEGGPTFCGDDCNDMRRDVRVGLSEVCDALDNDCDGATDETVSIEGYVDADYDLHGDGTMPISSCAGLPGFSTVADDCDDANPSRHGAQVEVCDGIDNDCDGVADESPASATWYRDADGDLFGAVDDTPDGGVRVSCTPPDGYVLRLGDCDDTMRGISPLAVEMCNGRDDNCNGSADYLIAFGDTEDDDRDGYADRGCGGPDCDDADPDTYPGAPELSDMEDNDCDGTIDETPGSVPWWIDRDGDGWGSDLEPSIDAVTRPPGRVARLGDCDDGDATVHPGVADFCDGLDADCDRLIDENAPVIAYYADGDGDGWGAGGLSVLSCTPPPGTSDRPLDCDDADPARFPGASELCNGEDTDCDGTIDEDSDHPWYPDADRDGFGSPAGSILTCAPPSGYVDNMDDCNDMDGSAYPMAVEECDGVDDDCDATIDETTAAMCADFPGSTGTCMSGACAITCDADFGDCNGIVGDGCETDTTSDPDHCGGCFTACSVGDTCGVTGVGCDLAPIVELAAGQGMSFGRRVGGALAVWGDGTTFGAHGAGGVVDQTSPARGAAPALVQVDAGWKTGMGVTTDGRLFGWGRNDFGLIGDGTTANRPGGAYTTVIPFSSTVRAMHVATGSSHSCAVVRDTSGGTPVNNVYCWGSNAYGQLGGATGSAFVAQLVPGIDDAQQVYAGHDNSCVLRTNPADGTRVYCWGRGNGGELGDGRGVNSTAPVQVISLPPDVVELVPGSGSRACVRTASLRVYCWGQWPGDGSGAASSPVIVAGVDDAIAASQGPSGAPDRFQTQRGVGCVIRAAGGMNEVWCWTNQLGALGPGYTSQQLSPVPILDAAGMRITGAVHVAAGYHHVCAVIDTGASYEVKCWGENLSGEMGLGSTSTTEPPASVVGLP